jgi:hypothetical protein
VSDILLDVMEQRLAKAIGKARTDANRSANVPDAKIGEQTAEQTDLEGFAAELAFCKMFNVYPDLSIKPRRSQHDSGDALTHGGNIVDVKSSVYRTAHLLAVPWKNSTVNVYVLMVGTFPEYRFAGFASTQSLFAQKNFSNKFNGYALSQEELQTGEIDD